jgi:hypothetical protein
MVIGIRTGHTRPVLLRWIQAIADDTVSLAPEDQESERRNSHWLSATPHERSTLSVDQVVAAFEETASRLRRRIGATSYRGTSTFYVWHDDNAGQLRCSVTSRPPTNLPLDGAYLLTDHLGDIIAAFLDDTAPGLVLWRKLEANGGTAAAEEGGIDPPVPVWICDVSPAGWYPVDR